MRSNGDSPNQEQRNRMDPGGGFGEAYRLLQALLDTISMLQSWT